MKKFVIIDGKSVFYRGYYAMPGLSLSDGTSTGGVYGFTSLALEIIRKIQPDYVAVAWDKSQTNIRSRKQIYPEYKANRKPAPPDFYAQIPLLHDLLKAFGWPLYECDDYEADDIMGALSKQANEQGIETILISSDLDLLQIVDHDTKLLALKKGFSNIEEFDIAALESKYGIKKEQFLDLKALKGDSSDNIPGVPGIGEKTAIELLSTYSTLDGVFANLAHIRPAVAKKLEAGRDLAYMSKKLSEIWCDAPVTFDPKTSTMDNADLAAVQKELKKLEFNSLIRRLPKQMTKVADEQGNLFFVQLESSLKPLEITTFDPTLFPAETLFVSHENTPLGAEQIWCSVDGKSAFPIELKNLKIELKTKQLVTYDAKNLLHFLAQNNQTIHFETIHDISQAAFLLTPLMRDFSLNSLTKEQLDDTNQPLILAAIRQLFNTQIAEFEQNQNLKSIADNFDFPLIPILFRMERRGIKIDPEFFTKMSESLATDLAKTEQEIFKLTDKTFNINSPIQLSEVLFHDLKLPTTGIKKTSRGFSTGQSELDKLKGTHPIIELIEKVRELSKLKSTYVDALPKLADRNDKIHTTFTQNVTSTGRLSSLNPNLQNIPIRTELGRQIRHGFVAEQGNLFVSADYSQFELRLAAVLAGDQPLIDDFNRDLDIHTKTASDTYGVPIEEVTKDQRNSAKIINFGILYGMSPRGLATATGMDFFEAKRFIDQYFTLRSPIRKFLDETLQKAKTLGFVETYYGRRRPTPDVNSTNFLVREAAKRAACNMPIQGTEADLMKRAMINLEKPLAGLGEQILQIHDSILVECPAKNAEKVAEILKNTMQSVAPELPIKLSVDVSTGKTWGDT